MALSGVDSGHHNHQTSGNLTSSCGDFLNKESTSITQEAWRNLNMSKTLHALNKKFLKNLQKYQREWKMLLLKKWRGKFLAFAVIIHFLSKSSHFKNKIK
jgi:biotin-(acetyl-CoA carboxylase) ligase